jgi:dihydroorotate dehydrogenase (NAD+) catalytic subunit
MDLTTKLARLVLKNPIIQQSGVLAATKAAMEQAARNGAGAVTTKSITLERRTGHPPPTIVKTEHGYLNAVGIANPGIDAAIEEFSNWNLDTPLIFNIVGRDVNEFEIIAEKLNVAIKNKKLKIHAVEPTLSCPHTPGFGTMAGQSTPEATAEITKAVRKKINLPIIIKLSPNAPALVDVAKAAEESGADAINIGNSVGPGMVIDIEKKKPVLGFGYGGMSGPAIKPIAVRCVYDLYQSIKIPIIGTGGVTYGVDAIEMMMAGATAVGVGTALYYRGPSVFGTIADEMKDWLEKHGYQSVKEIIGIAHTK